MSYELEYNRYNRIVNSFGEQNKIIDLEKKINTNLVQTFFFFFNILCTIYCTCRIIQNIDKKNAEKKYKNALFLFII
jgi:hypothetical protein